MTKQTHIAPSADDIIIQIHKYTNTKEQGMACVLDDGNSIFILFLWLLFLDVSQCLVGFIDSFINSKIQHETLHQRGRLKEFDISHF